MNPVSLFRRFILAAGLALAALAPAALGSPVADAQPPVPTISPLRVQAYGTGATVSFTSSEPVAVSITHQPMATGATGQPAVQVQPSYATTHEFKLTGLTSNTRYQVSVAAETRAGQRINGSANFYTARMRVRVTLREINITKDGDAFWMNGEPSWLVRLEWAGGETGGCYPNNGSFCETGSHGEGRIFPRNYLGQPLMWLFAEENFDTMPAAFSISAKAEEFDIVPVIGSWLECWWGLNCPFGAPAGLPTEWRVPAGQEFGSTAISLTASKAKEGFESTMHFTFELFHDNLSYPAARNTPQSTWAR